MFEVLDLGAWAKEILIPKPCVGFSLFLRGLEPKLVKLQPEKRPCISILYYINISKSISTVIVYIYIYTYLYSVFVFVSYW